MLSFLFRRIALATFFLCALVAQHQALAIVPACVSTAAQLQTALTAAATDHQFNYIALATGTYNFATPLTVNVSDGYALTIEGGYAAGCAGLPTTVPDNTLITGTSNSGAYVRIVGDGGLTLRNLTFSGFKAAAGTNAILIGDNYASSIVRVENTAISGNGVNGINDSILAIYPSGGLVFHDNIVHNNANAFAAVAVNAQYPGLSIAVANNTIASNAGPGLAFNVYSLTPAGLYNNILWNNGASDLIVTNTNGNEPPLALNNTWQNCGGCASLSLASANNSNADPKLTGTFHLGATSPAINAGLPMPMVLGLTDAAENLRVQGSAPDQGAYETATDDLSAHTYTVTSSADDSSIGSLRGAITTANSQGVPARVRFQIGSNCNSSVIVLNTPLPPITVPMVIDGYTQPGAAANTLAVQPAGDILSNAANCVILFGATVTPRLADAISVSAAAATNVHVEVRGLAFENFAAAIDLSGGYGHWIHGNNFFGPFFGSVVGNVIGLQIDGGFADVVGGPLAADVNLISVNSGLAGVLISGGVGSFSNGYHTITNNSIGGDATGLASTYGNTSHGVDLQSTRQALVTNNYIVANGGDGIRIDGAIYSLIQGNQIGSALSAGLGNSGAGVHVVGSGGENWIGTTEPSVNGNGNVITRNSGPGVWIDVDAGKYNQVTGNSIVGNTGLAIDIALTGPTPNAGNESTGPNYLIHKPVLASAISAGGSNMTVTGSIVTEAANTYRYVSVYASHKCGEANVRLGTYVVQAGANGTINLNLSVPVSNFSPAYITATDDDYTAGINDTSEISNSKVFSLSDDLFNDSFDCY
jgi:hypothetical protein